MNYYTYCADNYFLLPCSGMDKSKLELEGFCSYVSSMTHSPPVSMLSFVIEWVDTFTDLVLVGLNACFHMFVHKGDFMHRGNSFGLPHRWN